MDLRPRMKLIGEEDFSRIHEASIKIMEETGIVFQSEEALEIFKKHGAKVNDKTVYISRKMVEDALETCPTTFKWRGRNDEKSVTVGEGLLIQPNVGPVYIQDLDNGRRVAKLEDFANIQKLCQASDVVNLTGSLPVDPSDVGQAEKHLHIMYETIKNSDKPLVSYTVHGHQANQMLDMVELASGEKDFLANNHAIGVLANSLSPLAYAEDTIETIIEYTKRNQVILLAPCIMAGISGPISLLGTAVLQNVELLAGIVLIQLIKPGNPVVYATASTTGYMKSASFSGGTPEAMMINIPSLQMGLEFYKLPVRTMCGINHSKMLDAQAGYETMQSLMMGMQSGAHIFVQCLGVLDAIMTTSYEKFILDEEMIRRVIRVSQGIDTSDKALSVDVIQEVGSQGTYLTHPNTFEHFRSLWQPTVSDWDSYDDWTKAGAEDVAVRANRKYKEVLQNAPETLIDSELDKVLKDYMNKAMVK